jgi:hypothetical protein
MGPDLDLQDFGILGAREVGEGLTTPRAPALIGRKDVILGNGWKMRMIPASRPRLAALLPAWPWRRRVDTRHVGGRGSGRGSRLRLTPEELLLAESKQGLELVVLGFELGLAIEGAGVHRLPVAGEPIRLELLLQPRADRTGTLRQRRGGTDRSGRRGLRRWTSGEPAELRDRNP